jgi:hypothetical protein
VRVVISGSRDGHPLVAKWMEAWVDKHRRPEEWVLGDAKGVDGMARAVCLLNGWHHHVEHVDMNRPSPQRYLERNARMIERCQAGDVLLAFPRVSSRGTMHTVGLAKKRGMTVHVAPAWPDLEGK